MTEPTDPNRPDDPQPRGQHVPFSQDIQHSMVSARVPEDVGKGVFATATMIIQTQDVFVLDFLSATVHPQQLVARVVLTVNTFGDVIQALRTNLGLYEKAFGTGLLGGSLTPPAAGAHGEPAPVSAGGTASPPAPGAHAAPAAGSQQQPAQDASAPRAEDLYDQLKLPDKMLGGVFSNAAMIRHTREDFSIDFMANFYPRAVVVARVFISAGRMLPLLETLSGAFDKFRHRGGPGPGPRQ